ncbi:hypothetical protein Misp01_65810 [Microtetraspora sp. NBRC 13810]|uniref:hypothetical protein n=1 Tax=Microtetraspora sp. NBRC 13810 TaxID=3030990 RepID=UPI0024A3A971|nr:hypothetical protein [Microtetraspora sp. NBRC 13810]GLW11453.1 hypothetical protein Misp01_65810 [Microtetraspora sp. NBRC 13810]
MPITSAPTPGTVGPAVHLLAGALTRALLEEGDGFRLGRFLADSGDRSAGLAAVRVLGADVLTPFVLKGLPLPGEDAALIEAAVRVYPAPQDQPRETALWRVREAALVRALAALGVDASGWEGLTPVRPARQPPAPEWVPLAVDLVRLACAAPPFTDATVREELARRRLDLTRGLVRALLRRDALSAARLARWLTFDAVTARPPLLAPALEHLEIVGADDARVLLETTIARRTMTRPPA